MIEALRALRSSIANAISRGKVMLAGYSPTGIRTMLQLTGLAGETHQAVELILPYGYSAMPDAGDVLILQVMGSRDHKVALGADNPACRIAGLAPGEFGFQDNQGQQVVFKRTGLVISTPLKVTGSAAEWDVTGTVKLTGDLFVSGKIYDNGNAGGGDSISERYDVHTHPDPVAGNTGPPDNTI